MRFRLAALLLGVLTTLATGCATTPNPLVAPDKAKFDSRLVGTWVVVDDKLPHQAIFVHIGGAGMNFPPGAMRLITVGEDNSGLEATPSIFFATTTSRATFLSVWCSHGVPYMSDKSGSFKRSPSDSYLIAKCDVSSDKIVFYFPDNLQLEKAAKAKHLPFTAPGFWNSDLRLTASPQDVLQLLISADSKIFHDGVTLHRVAIPKE